MRLKSGHKRGLYKNNHPWMSACQWAQASASNLDLIETSDVTALGLYITQLQQCEFHYVTKVLVVITLAMESYSLQMFFQQHCCCCHQCCYHHQNFQIPMPRLSWEYRILLGLTGSPP